MSTPSSPQPFGLRSANLSPRCQGHKDPEGYGSLFAVRSIQAGELICVWGGQVLTWDELQQLSPKRRSHSIQVEEGLYLSSFVEEPADWANHSCDPNAGLSGQIALVAMRDIQPGEEICFDYAMSDGTPYDEFVCECGAENCRGYISGDDWRRPELQERYRGYFSPYLQRRIDQMNWTEIGPLEEFRLPIAAPLLTGD
jgi:uncharacterized protein